MIHLPPEWVDETLVHMTCKFFNRVFLVATSVLVFLFAALIYWSYYG